LNGKIVAFDDNHVVIQGENSIHLIRAEDIIEIELEAGMEIVAP
jgi:RNase P/RNase MRP subunit p29